MATAAGRMVGPERTLVAPDGSYTPSLLGGVGMSEQSTLFDSVQQAEVEYRNIPGFPGYRAGADGNLWTCWKSEGGRSRGKVLSECWKRLKPNGRAEDGRARYTLKREDGTYRRAYGSHFVLLAFVGPCPPSLEACHNDGNCLNDAADNLRWDTHVANLADRRKHGTHHCGEQINTAKLTPEKVLEARRRRAAGEKLKTIAASLGVTETLVSLIARRKVWTHVA